MKATISRQQSLSFGLLLAATGLAYYATSLKSTPSSAPLVCTPAVLDFGEVKWGEMSGEVTLTNESDKAIQIDRTLVSCSCQEVEVPRARLEPGQSVKASYTWDTGGEVGESSTGFRVVYSVAGEEKWRYLACECRGVILLPFDFEPEEVVFDYSRKEVQTAVVKFSGLDGEGIAVTDAEMCHGAFSAEIGSDGREVLVTYDPGKWHEDDSPFDHNLRVQTSLYPGADCRVPVRCTE